MKILFDNEIFISTNYGGISRYFVELWKRLEYFPDVKLRYQILYSENKHLKEAKISTILGDLVPKSDFKGRYRIIKFINEVNEKLHNRTLIKGGYDLFVPTYYDTSFLNYLGTTPFVLTVHDMIHELFPHYFPSNLKIKENKKELIYRANKIIAVSQNTKKDILRFYPDLDENKIEVVYLSHSTNSQLPSKALKLPKNYLLFVGRREGYKNFDFFLKAVAPMLRKDKKLYLVCTGPKFNLNEIKVFESLGVRRQIFHFLASDAELKSIYSQALVFIFPSEYEGFGIPVLEAMSSGCPTVLSNTSSFPEVGGEAASYFELGDYYDLSEKIKSLISDKEIRKEKVNAGLEQAKKFSWELTTSHCYRVFKSALSY